MKHVTPIVISFSMLFSTFHSSAQNSQTMQQPVPAAPQKEKILTIHGHQRVDPYFWMNERDSKDVLSYIDAENKHAEAYFGSLKPLQETLLDEFEHRIDPNDQSAPFFIQGNQYQYRSIADQDYEQIVRFNGDQAVLFLDENERAKGKPYYDLGDWSLSTNNQLLAFSEDHIGRRKYTIFFRDEKSGKILKDQIKDTDGSIVWANDQQTVFYVRKDPKTLREFQVFRHKLGTDSKQDVLVFEEKDERFSVYLSKTITDSYVSIHVQSSTTSEVLLIDAAHPANAAKVFLARQSGHLYDVEHHETGFFVLSNENASNKKILFYKNWPSNAEKPVEVLPHSETVLLEHLLVLKNYIAIQTRTNGLQQIRIQDLHSKAWKEIEFSEEAYAASLTLNEDYDAPALFYAYTSMSTPASVFRYVPETGEKTVFFQKKLIDPKFDPANYQTKRVWATANDGTRIPVSLLYRKDTDLSKAPMLLYGYGSYGVTIPATFSALRLSLVDRGFVYAIAHIRGGKYMGESWYENGKFLKKKNTFTDFINAAEYLGKQGYCDPERIYAQGGSAGGLLMGAVTNMAPYLWKGVVAQVPFVDVVTTMLDDQIPLTVGEYEEWGNPNEADYYWYMLNYSPYDNVRKMDYPAMYITTGYHDSQVQYWEPLKWVAKLRALKTNDQPLVFDCNMDAGHGGGSGRSIERLEIAKEYAFILGLEGIQK